MVESGPCIISGLQLLIDQAWVRDHAVIIDEGLVKAIIPSEMIKHHLPAKRYEFSSDHYLVPGLIDLHIHGAAGCDVMDGSVESLNAISHALAAEGVTGYLATTMTAEHQRIEAVLRAIVEAAQQQTGAAILGVHLEGPFIAAAKMGAQAAAAITLPDIDLVKSWQALAQGKIKLITLAPELPGALDFIKQLRKQDIVLSIGHTNASYAETMAAIEAGCSQATHLFNAMRGLHQREPGALGALLLAKNVSAELIVDGVHLHPAIVEMALQLKGKHHLLLVTDAMRAKCLGDGKYDLGGQQVSVQNDQARLDDGTLAGSTLRLPQAIKNIMQFTQCSLADAISMATHNPARVLRLDDRKGRIAVGMDADLVVMNAGLDVLLTLRAGREMFKAS